MIQLVRYVGSYFTYYQNVVICSRRIAANEQVLRNRERPQYFFRKEAAGSRNGLNFSL